MNIILISDSYPPEIRSASQLMSELAHELKERGNNVTVATSFPKYNLSEKENGKSEVYDEHSVEDGIEVIRIKTLPHHKVNFMVRGIAQITMPYFFISRIKKYIKGKIDVVIVYSPPLPLYKVGFYFKRKMKSKFLLNIQDIFPQNAIDLGILKNPFMIKAFEIMEKKAYCKSDMIFVHSMGNANFISTKYSCNGNGIDRKIVVLHNWIDVKGFKGLDETAGIFRKIYGLEDKFIILFAGVMGPSQGLDFVIAVAEKVKDYKDIVFLLVGDGMEKENLLKIVEDKKLKNVIFKPFVSQNEYPKLAKDADVGLVSLTSKNKTPVVPGKITGYMAASIPVLAFLNKESDGHKIISDADCGYSCLFGDIESAVNLVMKMYKDRPVLREKGLNGLNYVSANFEKRKIIDELESYFK